VARAAQQLAAGLRKRGLVDGEHRIEPLLLLQPLAEQLLRRVGLPLEEPGEDAGGVLSGQAREQALGVSVRWADPLRQRRQRLGSLLEGGGEAHGRVSSSTQAR